MEMDLRHQYARASCGNLAGSGLLESSAKFGASGWVLLASPHPGAGAQEGRRRELEEMVIEGVKTSIPLLRKLLTDPTVLDGSYAIKYLEEWLADAG